MDMTVDKQAAALLAEAVGLLNNKGQHWTKGRFVEHRSEDPADNAYCAVGAVRAVDNKNPYGLRRGPVFQRALEMLAETVTGKAPRSSSHGMWLVIDWNDDPNRAWPEVRSTFQTTIRKLRGK